MEALLRLLGLRHRSADDAGHVGAVLLLRFEEGFVLARGDGLLFAFDRRQGLLGLGLRDVVGLDALDRVRGLLCRLARGPLRGSDGRGPSHS